MNVPRPSRLEWIDVLKGLGILAVVAGHVFSGTAKTVIFLFHMPLFFFLGGYLLRVRPDWKRFLIEKLWHLGLPYLAFLLLLYPAQILVKSGGALPGPELWRGLIRDALFGGQALSGWTGVFWFVTCFFLVQQVVNALLCLFSRRLVAGLMALMLAASYAGAMLAPGLALPWNAQVVLAAAPIYYLGHLYREYTPTVSPAIALGLAILAMVLIGMGFPNSYDMKYNDYGIPLVTLVSSLAVVLVLMDFSKRLASRANVASPLIFLGKASMVIMFLHQAIQASIRDFLLTDNEWVRFAAATLLSAGFYALVSRSATGRRFFLGAQAPKAKSGVQG